GHEYDFSGTAFASRYDNVPDRQTASGTEMMANSIRHNRVRETELFRHFLKPFNFYGYEDGAYGFGNRLPYDQTDLIASLAPRAIIIENTVNDYNDGCESDALSAEVAKSVYNTLGYSGDDLVKFNYRALKPSDPHGNDTEQRTRSAKYLNNFFFGTELDTETAVRLDTDPFALNVTNFDTPYNVYYGGYNTITGGSGADARDGWYYYTFPANEEVVTPAPNPVTPVPQPVIPIIMPPIDDDPETAETIDVEAQETPEGAVGEDEEGKKTESETVTNEDGTETTTTTTEYADGSTRFEAVTKDEEGNIISSETREAHIGKNGTTVEVISTENADGSGTVSTIKTTKAGEVTIRTEENDPKGNVSITIEKKNPDNTEIKKEYVLDKDGKLKLTGFTSESSECRISGTATVNGRTYDVTKLAKNTFRNNKDIKKAVIGKKITVIGLNSFRGASNLSEIVIYAENLRSVSKNAFKGIADGAVFKIKGDEADYERVVELLKKSGLDENVKFKQVK
ncbi:MAG: leucine-rich repeat protein, partial [Lachnospiraceae bacterium]|nr:leucine-rich repeat protein [Lachnospiraceae bacterium]